MIDYIWLTPGVMTVRLDSALEVLIAKPWSQLHLVVPWPAILQWWMLIWGEGIQSDCAVTAGCYECWCHGDSDVNLGGTGSKLYFKNMKWQTGATKMWDLKAMFKEKFSKLENRVFPKHGKELLRDFTMNTRCMILRVCLIQGLISGWFRLGGIIKACILKNENYCYFGC